MKKDFTRPNTPATPVNFYEFYWTDLPEGAGKTKITTSLVDYDVRSTDYWYDTLDCQFLVSDPDFMGSDGVAVGDPRWESNASVGIERFNASGLEMTAFPNPIADQFTLRFTLDTSSGPAPVGMQFLYDPCFPRYENCFSFDPVFESD